MYDKNNIIACFAVSLMQRWHGILNMHMMTNQMWLELQALKKGSKERRIQLDYICSRGHCAHNAETVEKAGAI